MSRSSAGRGIRVLRPTARPAPAVSPENTPHAFATHCLPVLRDLRSLVLKASTESFSRDDLKDKQERGKALLKASLLYEKLENAAYNVDVSGLSLGVRRAADECLHGAGTGGRADHWTDAVHKEHDVQMTAAVYAEALHRSGFTPRARPTLLSVVPPKFIGPAQMHTMFKSSLTTFLSNEKHVRGLRVGVRVLLHTEINTVLQVDLGSRRDPLLLPQMKVVVLVSHGELCFVRFGAMTEKLWSHDGKDYESRHEVFRQFSQYATQRMVTNGHPLRCTSTNTVTTVILFLQMYTLAFVSPCVVCRRVMRDFLPPTCVVEINNFTKPTFSHIACAQPVQPPTN